MLGLAHALLADVGVDTRNHDGDFALALIAKGTGYFGHGKGNRRGWEACLLDKRAQRYDMPNVGRQKKGAFAKVRILQDLYIAKSFARGTYFQRPWQKIS
ncbi:hypothetical protein GCM10022409_06740 [Hymenobacter glaciei]|uniref:Uncharacterized protein n=1 Tax=Hymenobacter glaciei TaxID=877209 RepID=A0ABP7TF99_9BACT